MSAKNQPENDPLILNELKIPGRTGPVSETPKVWGINRAAALDNFPRQGLLCQAGPWAPMNPHDRLVIYKNKTQEILREIVNSGEVNTELQMFVEARHITEDTYTLSYSVTRLGGVAEDSLETQVLVKLTRPGGEDHSEEPGHPNLVMTIPEEILKGGIDEDNVASGVPITIGKPDDKPPYPFAAAGDVIRVSWGGVFVLSAPLTQAQADGTESIIVKIDAATIRNAGDSDDSGLAVVFEVYDLVDNRSSDWSVEQRVLVAVDKTRLVAPLLKEAQNNVLDVDKLGDADGTAQVWVSGASFKVGDIPILKIRGTPQEGPPVDIEVPGDPLVSVPTTHETKIDNRILRQLAKSQIALSYRLEKADGSADLPAKTQFISVIGEVQRLEAPVALDAKQGALDPLLPQVRIEVPFDASFAAGQVINLFWLGTRPDLEAYLPTLPPRLITQGDYDAKEPLLIIVDKKHLTPIIGGKLELYYQLLIEDSVFNQMDRFQQTRAIRESKHADILQIGEARKELPEPTVDGVVDGVLPADTSSTTLTVNYLKTLKDDIVTRFWEGSITGVNNDWVKLSAITAGKPVPFTIKAELIKGNEGGTVKAYYQIERAAGGTSYSDTLEFSVAVTQTVAPTIANITDANGIVAPNGTTLETSVTVTGDASPDQTVQLYDNDTALTPVVPVDANGEWSRVISGLSKGAHPIKAKALYSEQPVSEVRSFSVASGLKRDFTSFTGGNWNGWVAGPNVHPTDLRFKTYDGNWVLENITSTDQSDGIIIQKTFSNVQPRYQYRFSIKAIRSNSKYTAPSLSIRAAGTIIAGPTEISSSSQWITLSGNFIPTTTDITVDVYSHVSTTNGNDYRIDDIEIVLID
ncbi:carbohydrate binding domain-containing protein [Pseudomonas sp. SDT291_1_S447]